MKKALKVLYAITLVLPIVHQAIVHIVGFIGGTIKEVKDKIQEAMKK